VGEDELARAKEHVKGRMVLGLEATGSRMSRLARNVLFDIDVLSLDQMLERVDAVTGDEVAALAAEFYDPKRLAAACVGADEDCFKTAAGAVSEALSA
jgi:predicted Zn-dependent peptidase